MRKNNLRRMLASVLAVSMLSVPAMAADTETATETGNGFANTSDDGMDRISMTNERTFEARIPLNGKTIDPANISWSLTRNSSPLNGNAEFHKLGSEAALYPNFSRGGALADWKTVTDEPFFRDITTTVDGDTLVLTFRNNYYTAGKESFPHASTGYAMDVYGDFTLTASSGSSTIGSISGVKITPYDTFHTMYDIYDEVSRLATLGDNKASTVTPYITEQSMGKSEAGYNMPYLIIAKDSKAVSDWLALTERAEKDPEGVAADLKAGKLDDIKVPVMYSNIHANEVAASDSIMMFAEMLMTNDTLTYNKLTGFTAEGEAQLKTEREAFEMADSELTVEYTNYLGSIKGGTDSADIFSGVVDLDAYYTQQDTDVSVDALLDDVFFILVPEENVEGRMYMTRTSSGGFDLNRDNSFQTQAETQNMQHLIGTYNPVSLLELHGQVEEFQCEPCSPPHEPNFEYDMLATHLMTGGEAFGAAAVANNDSYNTYVIPQRDYLWDQGDGSVLWGNGSEKLAESDTTAPWDDMSTSYTPQFAMLHGTVAYTVELPAYNEATTTAAAYGQLGQSEYIAENKLSYLADQVEIFSRGVNNENSNDAVGPWLVDENDTAGAEADVFRPTYDGAGENQNFYPECYIIPLDGENQSNLQAAYDMLTWLTRNDVKVQITDKAVSVDGVSYPAGTAIVSMYQAKRSVANGALYNGTVITGWPTLYSEGITAFGKTRGFDVVTCAQPTAYKTIAAAFGTELDYSNVASYAKSNEKSVLLGEGTEKVMIANASEDSTAAVNTLLRKGETVSMISAGDHAGDFLVSMNAWKSVADSFTLTGIATDAAEAATEISKAPVVYIAGAKTAWTMSETGYPYATLVNGSYGYNYDRFAMDLMGFSVTDDPAKADVIVGCSSITVDSEAAALAAVKNGTPYVTYYNARGSRNLNENLTAVLGDSAPTRASADGMDALAYVTYPTESLTTASYVSEGDDLFYGYGAGYFTTVPDGAQVLVRMDGSREPLEGFLNGDAANRNAYLNNSIQAFSFRNVTAFANTLTNKVQQRDEYAFISNTIFASMMAEDGFRDVNNHWAAASIQYMVDNGIMNGTTATTFEPNATLSRAMIVTMLYRMDGATATGTNAFTDVAAGEYFADAVTWAAANGVVTGTSETTFDPYTNVTREQLAAMLCRYASFKGEDVTAAESQLADFADASSVQTYAVPALSWAVHTGIINGRTATALEPAGTATRAEAAVMMQRFAQGFTA